MGFNSVFKGLKYTNNIAPIYRDIFVYFNVNLKLLTKLINSAFVGEWTA